MVDAVAAPVPAAATPAAAAITPSYPAAVTAPVTLAGIVSDLLSWAGLPALGQNSPIPAIPIPEPLAALWIGVREIEYRFDNRYPNAKPTTNTEQPFTGVITGNLNATDPDGDHLTYTVATAPKNGTVVVNDDGSFTYTPSTAEAAAGGTDTFSVTVSDDNPYNVQHVHGLLDLFGFTSEPTVSVPITVTPVSTPAISVSAVAGTPDPTTGVTTITLTGSDSAGNPLTYTATSSQGTIAPNPTSTTTLTFTPGAGYTPADVAADPSHAVDTIAITATDGTGAVGTTNVTITQKPITAGPLAITEVDTSIDTTTGKQTVTITATDPAGKTITYSVDAGSLTANADGTYTYVVDPAFTGGASGHDPITYTLTASDGTSSTTALVAVATQQQITGNTNPSIVEFATNGLPSATDLGGVLPTGEQTTLADGTTLTIYTLSGGRTLANDTVAITTTAGVTEKTTYTQAAVAQPPTISRVDATQTVGIPGYNLVITATDPASQPLTYTADTGTLTANADGSYAYLEPAAMTGKGVAFTLTGTDTNGESDSVTVDLVAFAAVSSRNSDPANQLIGVNSVVNPAAAYTDKGYDLPQSGTVPGADYSYFVPVGDTLGVDPIKFFIPNNNDSVYNTQVMETTRIVDTKATLPPTISHVAATQTVGVPGYNLVVTATDPANQPLTYTADKGTLTANADGSLTYLAPTGSQNGPVTFELTGTDANGQSDSLAVQLAYFTGTAVDNAGVGPNGESIVYQSFTVQSLGAVHEIDEDGEPNAVRISQSTDANGVVTYTYRMSLEGETVATHPVSAEYEQRDAQTNVVFETTTFVDPKGTFPPTISKVAATQTLGVPGYNLVITATDPANQPLTYTADKGTLTANTDGSLTYLAPTGSQNGPINFELTGTDTNGQSDSTLVHLAYFIGTGVDDLGPDSDGDDIVFQTVTLQSAGPIHEEDEDGNISDIRLSESTDVNGVVTYTFRMDHPGDTVVTHPVSAVYEGRDAANDFVFETTTLIDPNGSLPTNHPPVAGIPTVGTPDPLTGAVSGALGFTDPDGDPLTYTVTTNPTSGTVTVTTAGNYTYVPTAADRFAAAASATPLNVTFVVTANDGRGGTTGESVTVPISAAQPTATNIAAGSSPVGIAVSPDGSRLYVGSGIGFNGVVTVIDTATHAIVGTIRTVDDPEQVFLSPDGSRLYVISRSVSTLAVVDTATNKLVGNIAVNNADRLAFTPSGALAYFSSGSSQVFDINTSTLVLGPRDSNGFVKPIVADNGSSQLTGIAISPGGGTIYVADFLGSTVSLISTSTNTAIGSPIPVGLNPNALALSPDGSRLYVTAFNGNTVSVIDTATASVIATITVQRTPLGVAFSPDGTIAYVANRDSNTVSVINVATNSVVYTIPVGNSPEFIAVSPDGEHVYVTLDGSNAVADITGV